jgi:hypothetical protein
MGSSEEEKMKITVGWHRVLEQRDQLCALEHAHLTASSGQWAADSQQRTLSSRQWAADIVGSGHVLFIFIFIFIII